MSALARPHLSSIWPTLGLCLLLTLFGCQSQRGPVTAGSSMEATIAPLLSLLEGGGVELVPALFDVTVDQTSMTAAVMPRRLGANFQGNLYDLDIRAFQDAESFRITGVRSDPDGNPIIDYQHAHPFGPPDLSKPVSAANRADLGYTGRLLFVGEVPSAQRPGSTFFSGLLVNVGLVANADGYLEVGDLLTQGQGFVTRAFPYRLIVDEVRNNRVGQPNSGVYTGNYDAASGGWQRSNLGSNNTGWIGYDYLHQGQVARSFVTLRKEAFQSGTATFTVAILIRYCDPRGTKDKANRLPQQPVDVLKFAYRLPYAALDCSKITVGGATVDTTIGSSANVTLRVRDWDARAAETTQTDLGKDSNVALVQQRGAGSPTVTISVPSLRDTLITATEDAPLRSGQPGDELRFTATIANQKGTATAGTIWALARMVDPEENDPGRPAYAFGVDPETLAGATSRALPVVTYQVIPVTVTAPAGSGPQCGSAGINGSGTIAPGGTFSTNLSTITDPDSSFLTFQFHYNGPSESFSSTLPISVAGLVLESAFNPFTDSRLTTPLFPPTIPGTYDFDIRLSDGASPQVICGPYLFTVQADQPPQCGSGVVLSRTRFRDTETVQFTANLSTITDPGNPGPVALSFAYTGPEADTSSVTQRSFPLPANFNPFTDGGLAKPLVAPTAAGQYTFTALVDDGVNSPVECSAPFEIRPCGSAMTDPDITGAPTFDAAFNLNSAPLTWYNFYTTQDYAAFADATTGYVCQRYDPADDPGNGTVENYDLWRFVTPGNAATAIRMTSYFTAGDQIAQVEIDQSRRVLYTFRPFDDAWDVGSNYDNPKTTVGWFDYSGAQVTAAGGSFQLPVPPVALTLDVEDGLWVIDTSNILEHYRKLPGTAGYQRVPADLINLGAVLGIGSSRVICDFVQNFHNGAFYILTNSGPSRNGRVYRVECDGTLWAGGTNPREVALSTGSQFPGVPDGGDIAIDQWGAGGVRLDGLQDAQLVVFHTVGTGGMYVLNAELEVTATSTGDTQSGARGTLVAVENYALTNEFGDQTTGEPWAWQDRWLLPSGWQ